MIMLELLFPLVITQLHLVNNILSVKFKVALIVSFTAMAKLGKQHLSVVVFLYLGIEVKLFGKCMSGV